jgi:hypothetical protein
MQDDRPLSLPLREFVLGSLDEQHRLAVEEQLVSDPGIFEALGLMEDDLLEDYVEDRLSKRDRQAFESHFLTTPERRDRAAFTRLLVERCSAERHAPQASDPGGGVPASWRLWPVWAGPLSASLVITIAVASGFAVRQVALNREVTSLRARLAEQSSATSLAPRSEAPPEVRLTAGRLRDGGDLTRVNIPADATTVRVFLMLHGVGHPVYRAAFHNADGDELWIAGNLREQPGAAARQLAITVPATLLPRGDYQIRVMTGVPASELIDTYDFRVTSGR